MRERHILLMEAEEAYDSFKESRDTCGPDTVRRARLLLELVGRIDALVKSELPEAILLPNEGNPYASLASHAVKARDEAGRLVRLGAHRQDVAEYWRTVPWYDIDEACFPPSVLREIATEQPKLCYFDQSDGKFYFLETGYKLMIDDYDAATKQVTKARAVPDFRPLGRVGEATTAQRLREVASKYPGEACYFEDVTNILWVRADKREEVGRLLGLS